MDASSMTSLTLSPQALAGPGWAAPSAGLSERQVKNLGATSAASTASTSEQRDMRRRVGEFVGGVFYGKLLEQMQKSNLKGKYMHGGRGEEVFQGQLNVELSKKLGAATNNPVTDRLFNSISKRLARGGFSGFATQQQQAAVEAAAAEPARQEEPGE